MIPPPSLSLNARAITSDVSTVRARGRYASGGCVGDGGATTMTTTTTAVQRAVVVVRRCVVAAAAAAVSITRT